MAEVNKIVEGKVKYREGKKWKPRWCVMKKPSPVADRLEVQLFKDVRESIKGGHPKSSFPLDAFYGLESGICFDKETSVLAIICHKQITLLAFDSRETLIQFEIRIRRSLGEEHQFPVRITKLPSNSKLPLDLVRMHIHGQKFCLTSCIPPKILASWNISDLRRFGTVDGLLCFEGGSRCGKGAGFHALCTDQADEIVDIIQAASMGKTASSNSRRRQSGKRRSEFVEPVRNMISDNFFKNFQNAQVYGDQNFQEDTSWPRPKRHSISFTDYKRAKTYAEKQRLMSIENVEKDRLMAIYDIPPRRVRKVETVSEERRDRSSRDQNMGACSVSNSESWTGEYNNNVMSYQVPMATRTTLSETSSSQGSEMSLQAPPPVTSPNIPNNTSNLVMMSMSTSAPALCGYGNLPYVDKSRQYSQSVPNQIDEEIERVVGVSKREEVLERLQQEERDLQREMSLLDEILEVCQSEEGKKDSNGNRNQPPPLPLKMSNLRGWSVENLPAQATSDNISSAHDMRYHRHTQSGRTTSVLLSPNLVNKMRKISSRSKASAPLHYVNLDRFDGISADENHVHIPAASTSAPGGNVTWSSLQSSRSRGYDNVRGQDRSENKENKRISVSLPGSRENLRHIGGSDSHLNRVPDEPIYANQRGVLLPPEIPPKGPVLLFKNRQVRLNAASRPPHPRPPDRRHSKQDKYRYQYQSPRQGVNPITNNSTAAAAGEEDYFQMGNFDKEPKPSLESQRQASREMYNDQQLVVTLPPKGPSAYKMDGGHSSVCYMDMSGMFQDETSGSLSSSDSVSVSSDSVNVLGTQSPARPKYTRSLSASSAVNNTTLPLSKPAPLPPKRTDCVSAGNSPREPRREAAIREPNYMLMSNVLSPRQSVLENLEKLQTFVSTTPGGEDVAETQEQTLAVPNGRRITSTAQTAQSDLGQDCQGNNVKHEQKVQHIESGSSKDITGGAAEREAALEQLEMPFQNLLDYTLHHARVVEGAGEGVGVTGGTAGGGAKMCKPPSIVTSGEKAVTESTGKTAGFFTRLIRRNSKDRKSMSQSQENLLSSASSESGLDRVPFREGMGMQMIDSSSSSESSRSQSTQELMPGSLDRSRSSSFPSRSSYIAMNDSDNSSSSTGISILSQNSDLGATNSSLTSCGTVSTHTSSEGVGERCTTRDSVLSDSEKSASMEALKGNYDKQSYFYVGPLESNSNSRSEEGNMDDNEKSCSKSESEETSEDIKSDKLEDNVSESGSSKELEPDKCGRKVFTVLCVENDPYQNCSKTDDEKLIDLWHSNHSLHSEKSEKESIADIKSKLTLPLEELSPDQKASAIARHISTLPPFVPPKMKSYPMKLSPVLERTGSLKKEAGSTEGETTPVSEETDAIASPIHSPAQMKQQAKATLRITPPSEDEHGKIWIPMSSIKTEEPVESDPEETKSTTLVVDLSDLEQAETLSLSSLDSSCHGEEMVRSSPASTILRPRSGKEYQKVERRRTLEGSNTTSPAITPVTPSSGASVFTFDTSGAQTCSSSVSCYGELHSPKLSKMSLAEQASMSVSMSTNVTMEMVQSPKVVYMNVDLTDMTPPESPHLPCVSPAPEQLDPQLNYAEIDLSEAAPVIVKEPPQQSSRKSKKSAKAQEPVNVEYATIDMVATVAAQKAGKEHAQNREGSLRRDRSSLSSASMRSSVSSVNAKDRLGSFSLPSSKSDRKQGATYTTAQSSTSVDSTF